MLLNIYKRECTLTILKNTEGIYSACIIRLLLLLLFKHVLTTLFKMTLSSEPGCNQPFQMLPQRLEQGHILSNAHHAPLGLRNSWPSACPQPRLHTAHAR